MDLPPQVSCRQLVFQTPYQSVYNIKTDFGVFQKEYFVNDFGGRVGVVLGRNDEVLLVQQYRLLVNGLAWEIPGGGIEEGEEPEQAAKRECWEEAGFRCTRLEPLISYNLTLDSVENPTFIFFSDDFTVHEKKEDGEQQ